MRYHVSVGHHDREAILARRALFISSALAGLSCTPTSAESPESPESPVVDGPTVIVEEPNRDPRTATVPDGARPGWSEVMAKAPPLSVPSGLTRSERQLLDGLESHHRSRYARLQEVWDQLPSCGPSAAGCEGWAEVLQVLEEVTDSGYGPLCGYSSDVTNTYLERDGAHERYIAKLGRMLLEDLDAAVEARTNSADSDAWAALRKQDSVYGRPCLSCMAPSADPIISAIAFPLGDGALPRTGTVESTLANTHSTYTFNRNVKATLIVRGHADPSEADPEGLAQDRADAVARELVLLGVDRRHLEIRNYGAALPITNDPAEAAKNARVDFEVVEP